MDISELTTEDALKVISAMESVEDLRKAAISVGLKFSGNTGEETLRTKLSEFVTKPTEEEKKAESNKEQPVPVVRKKKAPTQSQLAAMDPNEIEDQQLLRQVVRARALRLHRVQITNLDPADAQLSGAIITVLNKYVGKVSKYVPFGDEVENGYHIPDILLNHLKTQKFALRKEIKGGQFGVKKYSTRMVNKYSIEHLPMLSQEELDELAAHQRASHAIDS